MTIRARYRIFFSLWVRPIAVGDTGLGTPYRRWRYGLGGALSPLAIRAWGRPIAVGDTGFGRPIAVGDTGFGFGYVLGRERLCAHTPALVCSPEGAIRMISTVSLRLTNAKIVPGSSV